MESFWHSLKVEEVHGRNYATREEATRAIVTYVEAFYNCERRHSSIDYLSPRQFEKQFYEQQNLNQIISAKQSTKTRQDHGITLSVQTQTILDKAGSFSTGQNAL